MYGCQCTRKQIKAMGGSYDRTCLDKSLDITNNPVRLKQTNPVYQFEDGLFGTQHCPRDMAEEDYIIKRRDGLFSYQLAVVVDDIDQGITHVVRGADIMPLTARQIALYHVFGIEPPEYIHLPLVVTEPGKKLSKQNHAQAINVINPIPELMRALSFLGFDIDKLTKDLSISNQPSVKQLMTAAIDQAKTSWSSPSSMKSAIGQDLEISI